MDIHRKAGHGEERQLILLGMNCESKHAICYYFAVHAQVMTKRQHQYTQSGHASLCKQCAINIVYNIYVQYRKVDFSGHGLLGSH